MLYAKEALKKIKYLKRLSKNHLKDSKHRISQRSLVKIGRIYYRDNME
jgi:hypothetical protein